MKYAMLKDRPISKKTQGHHKMIRYIDDLIRNKNFKRLLKRLRNAKRHLKPQVGFYKDWTADEQKKHDKINGELTSIVNGYEALRKRCKKVFGTKDLKTREIIAAYYGLDNELIDLALAMSEKRIPNGEFLDFMDEPDMCRIVNLYDEELNPENPGEEIIHLRPLSQLSILAFPIAIAIHPRASKNDVLAFIEKKWKWVDSMRDVETGILKFRKRKHSQNLLDFIWAHHSLPAKKIMVKLREKFPNNGLVYYEIGKIIQLEKERRLRNLT